eukprot:451710_1
MKPYMVVLVVVVLIELCASYQQCCVSIRHKSEGKCGAELSQQTPDICFSRNDKLKEVFNDNKEYCIWDCDGHLSSMYNRGHYISILSEHAPSHLYPNYMKLLHVDTMGVAYTVVHNLTIEFTSNIIPIYYNVTKRRRLINENDFKKIATYKNPTTGTQGAAQLPFQATGVLISKKNIVTNTKNIEFRSECVASVIYKKKTVKSRQEPPTPAKYDIALLTSAHCCYDDPRNADWSKVEFHNIDQNGFPGDTSKALLGDNTGSPKYKYFYRQEYASAALINKYFRKIYKNMQINAHSIDNTNKIVIGKYVKMITDDLGVANIKKAIKTIKQILKDVNDVAVNTHTNVITIHTALWASINWLDDFMPKLDWCIIKWTKIKWSKNAKHTLQIKSERRTTQLGKLLMSTYRTPKQKPPGKTYYKRYFVTKVHVIQKTPSVYWLGHGTAAQGQSGSPFVEESDPTKIRAILSTGINGVKNVQKDWLTVITETTFYAITQELSLAVTHDGKGKVAGTAQAIASDYGDYQQSMSYHQHHQHHQQKIYVDDGIKSDYPVIFGVGIISSAIVTGTIGFICIFIGILIGVIAAKFVWNLNKKY